MDLLRQPSVNQSVLPTLPIKEERHEIANTEYDQQKIREIYIN
jgi:hypothetical protein